MYPQRLPIVDDDDGVWGDILRKYLLKEHYDSGTDNADNGGHKNVTIRAGTAGVGGAPLKFTSGTLLTAPEVGAVEFAGDNLYVTQTSGTTRKKVALYDDASGATGDMYYRNSGGYFTRLAAGAASQILTISGGVPTWQTPTATSTFTDNTFFLQDDVDATKKAQFQLQNITTNTTRTLTIPNSSGTIYVTGGTDVSVADGGTGRSTATTAYGIIAAGTTAAGAQQTISPGTSGQFLKSAGASALAAFANITAADITGTTAQFNAALSDNDFATLAGNEILTNKTLTNPKIGTILDTNGNTSLDIINNTGAVNHVYINNQPTGTYPGIGVDGTDTNIGFDIIPKGTGAVRIYAATGNTPTLQAVGAGTNLNFNLISKGTGRIQANGVNIPTVSSSDTLTNKIINGGDNTISNIPWAAVSKPAVIAAGATIGEALSAVDLTKIVGGFNDSDGRVRGAYARNALYSHPESPYFVPIPHAYNDIAFNNIRGGSVAVTLNGATVAPAGNNASQIFTPDAAYELLNFYSSTSDTIAIEITLHRTFHWAYGFGIQQTDWCRGQNIKFEAYNGTSWTTILDQTNEPTGLTWSSTDAGSTGITRIRVTLTNFSVAASTGCRVSQVFLIGYDSPLLSGTFLPRSGGQLYGDLATPGLWTNTIKDISNNGTGILDFYGVPSAVNYLQIQNASSGNTPGIYAQGANANINLSLTPKGTGTINASSSRITNVTNPTGAQDAATKSYVDSAIGGSTGVPYDLSIISFGTYTARVANSYGDFPMGIKLQRAVTFTQVVYRVNTADASGNLVVQLRKNGSTVSGTSATIAAANQVTGGAVTGSWAFAAGDILTVYVTGVGTTPGAGLIADIKGSTT